MTYEEAQEYVLKIPLFAKKLGTDNLNSILEMMGHPERSCPVIHIAGTNGKGSTCLFLASILKENNKRVGIFTSPHLMRINERIRIGDEIISDDDFVSVCEEVITYVDKAEKQGIAHPSFFEFVFLMAALYFKKQQVDFAVFEAGMGGRLDATNVVVPAVSIITSVGLDHMQYLGDTIEEIAGEKAGIIKPGIPVVYFDRKDAATDIIKDKCIKENAKLHTIEKKQCNLLDFTKKSIDFSFNSVYYKYDSLQIRRTALYQIENAVLAIRAYELLQENNYITEEGCVAEAAIRTGLMNMIWHGRMEQIDEHIYVDGAHNVEAIEAFCNTLEVLFSDSNKILLFAVSKDKDYRNMIKSLGRISFDEIIIVRYSNDRSAELDTVEDAFRQFSGSKITTFDDIKAGYEYGKAHVENKVLFCVGSLYLVGDLLNIGV
ncbi:MAG: bifunctional folylpolyglutamate synthase/dihydrofolate synthase [Lachnospiraceae bacterium]|nr:bifunctional folylpolyglutamate synthase/dihydrofolate synthase [Lachnospiraceae bacterium]